MKKSLLFILTIAITGTLFAQLEDFETCELATEESYGTLPEGWTRFIDGAEEDNDKAWKAVTENARKDDENDTDSICLKMNEWFVAADLWLVTKQFSPAANGEFKFYATDSGWKPSDDGGDDNDRVNLEVYVCIYDYVPEYSDDFELDPLLVIEENDNSDYEEYTLDLSAFVGQNIYIGFKVANQSTWSDSWWIDDVSGLGTIVSNTETEASTDFNIYPNPSNGEVTLENINRGTISVINMSGQEVKRFENVRNNETINLNVESGIYFIRTEETAKKVNIVK